MSKRRYKSGGIDLSVSDRVFRIRWVTDLAERELNRWITQQMTTYVGYEGLVLLTGMADKGLTLTHSWKWEVSNE